MAITRYDANFLVREDIFDNITPNNVVQEEIRAPAGEWKPAAWLPVQWTSTNRDAGTDAYVISSGKVVAMDTQGRLVPAGIRLLLEAGAGSLAYTATDVTWGVTDLTTGARVAAAVSYSSVQVAQALIERGLVLEQDALDAGGTVPPTIQAHADIIIDLFISEPVGIAAYDYHVWAGLPEDGDQWFTNYNKQHLVQFLTEVQMQVPQLVASENTGDSFDPAALDLAGSAVAAAGEMVSPTEYWDATNLAALTRYGALTAASEVVALGFDPAGTGDQYRVARNTTRTPVGCDTNGVLVRERTSWTELAREGDWYLDAELGVLFLHSDTWDTLVAAAAAVEFTYSYYTTTAADAHRYVHFDGPIVPGRKITYDDQSNFREATAAELAAGVGILGQVLAVQVQPRTLLDKVKTAWQQANFTSASQMPGTATSGYTDLITLSTEVVADQVVILNVRVG